MPTARFWERSPRGIASLVLLALGLAAAALAANGAVPDPKTLLKVDATLAPTGAGKGTLSIRARLESGWHVNSHKPSEDYLIATEVKLDPADGVRFGEAKYPEGKLQKFAFSDTPLSVYAGEFVIEVPVEWSGSAPPAVSGSIAYQTCNDAQCLAPTSLPFHSVAAPAAASGSSAAPSLSGGAVPLAEARRLEGSTAAAGASEDFGDLLKRRGLAGVLLLLFGWGLALNLTPCVYPVIPLTVSFFGGQAHGQSRRAFLLAAVYVLGMATMYSALGVAAALSGRLFGAALQSPWVLAGIAAVLVALALSMFGLYDIRMPTALMQKAGARQGFAGAYGMGLLVGVVAAPCVGPVVLGLLAFVAATQDAALGFLFFFVLSLGLGLPFLFLAAFSGRIAALPRAGAWMEGVKKVFGWILLAMAAYFVRNALPGLAGAWLLPAVLVIGALALLLVHTTLKIAVRGAVAVLFLAAALFFAPSSRAEARGPEWAAYDPAKIGALGRPAVVDFSASWCLPCIELDKKTFSDPRVRDALNRRGLFKADMTKAAAPETMALAEKYAILGVPTVIFLDASGQERKDLRLVGFEEPDAFLKRLEKAP
ncbi:MAG TPA: cytochrome c biogenesis protein CcdA [Thermoanaerobaculia bacterium]|nr:cytochrome c biogenesis protein CcdA [Thermoanaerobaculia bacterium]